MDKIKTIGFLGLGNMGLNMVKNLLDKGYTVHAWNRSPEPRAEALAAGAKVYESIADLIAALPSSPKVIMSMVSAGEPVDMVIEQCLSAENRLTNGDIFVDGVNSFYKDSIKRSKTLAEHGVVMLDAGVSGGITGARNGACAMVGGDKEAYEKLEHLFADIAQPDGYGYFGGNGAGHFVKMVHNAIEYGMMQSLAEGLNLIEHSEFAPDMAKLTDVWNHGSIIQGNLMGYINEALKNDAKLSHIEPQVGSLGTGRWAVEDALQRGLPFNAIAAAVFARSSSNPQNASHSYKVLQAMREVFGGHSSSDKPAQ